MKRRDLIRHLEVNGCRLLREGGNHSIWENKKNKKRSAIPRHKEIVEFTAIKICNQLEISKP
ncbi:MAG: type II toxin-antitoxin system HicA family toxin [Acidobacteriota bacterium]|nr:type II toxin-antitoxin system HicA family toxin [Acidobacteriota bacterium]